ncbi:MAG: hypothetical protein ACYDHN_01180 [Solirubrobacteraceae bacterium]
MRAALVLRAPSCSGLQLLQPAGELIANALEPTEVEQARATHLLLGAWRGNVGERVGDDAGELPLESRDLPLQRSPGSPLARVDARTPAGGERPHFLQSASIY